MISHERPHVWHCLGETSGQFEVREANSRREEEENPMRNGESSYLSFHNRPVLYVSLAVPRFYVLDEVWQCMTHERSEDIVGLEEGAT